MLNSAWVIKGSSAPDFINCPTTVGSTNIRRDAITINENRDLKTVLQVLEQQGYARLKWNDTVYRIPDFPQSNYKNEALL